MAIITDEQMRQWANLVGHAYVVAKDAMGDAFSPGTSHFEIDKLYRYVNNQLPIEGLVSGCEVSIPVDTSLVHVASGTLRYADQTITFTDTEVSISKTFQYPFAATAQYGVVVAINRADMAEATQAVRTSIDAGLTANVSTTVSLTDTTALGQFTLPLTVHVVGETLQIWALDSNGDGIVSASYNGGTVAQDHAVGSVAYVSKPLDAHVVFGLPVDVAHQTGGNPATFAYYPPISEQDYIVIGRGLVDNPNTTTTARTPILVAVEDMREIVDDPADGIFTEDEMVSISSSVDMFKSILAHQGGFSIAGDAMTELVAWSNNQVSYNFETYWNDRPFSPTSGYVRGESFWGIGRTEFDEAFKEAYRDVYSSELLTTLAIFRGDIAGGDVTYGHPPTGLAGTPEIMPDQATGNLSYGQWTYRVSTISSGGESSASSAVTIRIDPTWGSTNRIVLTWDVVTGATSYGVYRLGSEGNTFVERRIATPTTATYTDTGNVVGTSVSRGVLMTGRTLEVASRLSVYVPPMEGSLNSFMDGGGLDPSSTESDTTTHNEMILTIHGIRSDGTVGGPHTVTIPKGTARSTKYAVGVETDLYVGLHDVLVSAGTDITLVGGRISWSPYDFVTIQNV